jgi:hypothetical protein
MSAARVVSDAERRARLGQRHHLASPASGAIEAAAGVVALHATDPVTVFLSAWARCPSLTVAGMERALYEERSLFRMLAMRRTMFVVPTGAVGILHAASGLAVAAGERRRLLKWLRQAGVEPSAEAWLGEVESSTLDALERRGEALAAELAEDEPRLRQPIVLGPGSRFEATTPASFRVLLVMAGEGRIARGRPSGRFTSTRYRWSRLESWLPGGLPHLDPEDARTELARRWLRAFGPATVADLTWWTGWTVGDARRALMRLETVPVDLERIPGILLAEDAEPAPQGPPWVALLPALDPTVMGWTGRDWYLGAHRDSLFDRNGNAGPTVWADGRVVGGWAQRGSGEIAIRLLEEAGHEVAVAAEEAAGRLAAFLGSVRYLPRFRTPLERELSS